MHICPSARARKPLPCRCNRCLSHPPPARVTTVPLTALLSPQLIPCALLALVSHPATRHAWINRVLWAFCVYVEAVSVAPQVIMMQRNRTVERFTGHYVFFLGLARFFSCAHWLLQMVDDRNTQLWKVRCCSNMWPCTHLCSFTL